MGLSYDQFSEYTPSQEQKEIIETVTGDSVLLKGIPWIDIVGDKYKIWREVDRDTSLGYRAINQGFQSGNGKIDSEDHHLVICGGNMDVDSHIVDHDTNGQVDKLLRQKMRSLGLKLTDDLIHGNASSVVGSFDGIYRKLARGNEFFIGPAGNVDLVDSVNTPSAANRAKAVARGVNDATAGLTMATAANRAILLRWINKAISRMPLKPDIMLMGSGVYNILQDALNESGIVRITLAQFGTDVPAYNGIPIWSLPKFPDGSDIMAFNEFAPDGTTTGCASILLIKFGTGEYYGGIRSSDINVTEPKLLDDNVTVRWTVSYNLNHILFRYDSVTRVGGILE